jgi:hypothetical protein
MLAGLDHKVDGAGEPVPTFLFSYELSAPSSGELVKLCLTSRVGLVPLRAYPSLLFKPVKRGIQRALLHLQNLVRDLLNALGDGPTVLRFERDRRENKQVQSALYEIAWLAHTMTIYTNQL